MECEALWVLVWEGCRCTGHLFPILKMKNSEVDLGYNKQIRKNDTEIFSLNMLVEVAVKVSALRWPPCLMILFGPPGCCGGGGGGGGGESWLCPCERSAVPYTATVRLVYQPRSTRPSVLICTHKQTNPFCYSQNQKEKKRNILFTRPLTFPLGLNTIDLFSSYSRLRVESKKKKRNNSCSQKPTLNYS